MNPRLLLPLLVASSLASAQELDPLKEYRYCGAPDRDNQGMILRRDDVLIAFQRIHPCPSTGLTSGPCRGWAKDHVIPLSCGGCDSVYNLQWLSDALKSAGGTGPKDRWERLVYANKNIPNPACTFRVVR